MYDLPLEYITDPNQIKQKRTTQKAYWRLCVIQCPVLASLHFYHVDVLKYIYNYKGFY